MIRLSSSSSSLLPYFVFVLLLVHTNTVVFVTATSLVLSVAPFDEECFLLRILPSSKPTKPNHRILLEGHFEQIDDHHSSEPLVVHIAQEISRDSETGERNDKQMYKSHRQKKDDFGFPVELNNKYWLCVQNHLNNDKDINSDSDDEDDDSLDYENRVVGFYYNLLYQDENGMDAYYGRKQLEKGGGDGNTAEDKIEAQIKQPGPVKVETYSVEWYNKAEKLRRNLKNLVQHHDYMKVRESKHRQVTEATFGDVLKWTLTEAGIVLTVAIGQVLYFRRLIEKKNRFMY